MDKPFYISCICITTVSTTEVSTCRRMATLNFHDFMSSLTHGEKNPYIGLRIDRNYMLNCCKYLIFKCRSLLTVKLYHGRDYTDELDNMSMDSFVKTRLLPSKRQTFTSKLQRRTLNPNYNETYQFDIEYSELSSQVLCFEVYRYDCVSRHNIFGEVIVPFKDLGSSGSGNVIKEISMSVNITEPDTASTTSPAVNNDGFSNNNHIIGGIKTEKQNDDVNNAW